MLPVADPQYSSQWTESVPALTWDDAYAQAHRCLYCFDAPCTAACPAGIDVAAFIKKIANTNMEGAARLILEANPFAHSCARACPTEQLCEGACVMHAWHRAPTRIAALQRLATDYALTQRRNFLGPVGAATGYHVAIVGAGPAGLTAATYLRRYGHAVTVFEGRERGGGLSAYGVAPYKVAPTLVWQEVEAVLQLGVVLKTGTWVGQHVTWTELAHDFDAVLIAVGLGKSRPLQIPGAQLNGVVDALDFLERVKMGTWRQKPPAQQVLCIGGGNTALDAARTAKRLGADKVTVVYRRGRHDMPAYATELQRARAEGVLFEWMQAPVRVHGIGRVEALECVATAYVPAPAEAMGAVRAARQAVTEVAGSQRLLPADCVIYATGQQTYGPMLAKVPGFTGPNGLVEGRVVVDAATGQTAYPKFFASGDCVHGSRAEIVHAVAAGKRAAVGIHGFLRFGGAQGSAVSAAENLRGAVARGAGEGSSRHG